MQQQNRRLAAILFTDIVGSTSMMQKDEQHAVSINKHYVAVFKEWVLSSGGEILNDFGDGSLCRFPVPQKLCGVPLRCKNNFKLNPEFLAYGLHVGEIFSDDGKVFGDGVNVASRVQSLGIANSILFSSRYIRRLKINRSLNVFPLVAFILKMWMSRWKFLRLLMKDWLFLKKKS